MRTELIKLIFEIAKKDNAFDILEKYLSKISKKKLAQNIIECGVLPEMFSHDSSEEKLWAKYSDIVLCQALNFLKIKAKVLGARGNSADVFGETIRYTIVGDAKTFRLSRTAKNQKDFKVSALDSWRKGNNYALLVSPLMQYPNKKSQIYSQACEKNVTLISYTHLLFLLDNYNGQNLQSIWEVGNSLKEKCSSSQLSIAENYWNEVDTVVSSCVGMQNSDIKKYKLLEIEKTKELGFEGINFWQDRIKKLSQLTKEDAIKLLIKAEKIDAKIRTIEKTISISINL